MDLYSITRSLWRHKLVTLPLLLVTLVGCVGVAFVKAPTYTTSATYILSPPEGSAAQAFRNPFLNYGGLTIVAQELTTIVSTGEAKAKLASQGATGSYTVAPSQLFGNSTPLIEIDVLASSPEGALQTANLVGKALVTKMNDMQAAQKVEPSARIRTLLVTAPSVPIVKLSGKLRDLIVVFVIGIMLIFVAVSIMNAVDERAVRRRELQTPEDAPDAASSHSDPERLEPGQSASWLVVQGSSIGDLTSRSAETGVTHRPSESSTEPSGHGIKRRLRS